MAYYFLLQKIKNKENILKEARGNKQHAYREAKIVTTSIFSSETMLGRGWSETFSGLFLLFPFSSVSKSCLILQTHGLQQARLHCPSQSLRVCSKWFPLSWWSQETISSSILLLLPSICPSIRVFCQWISSSHQVAKLLELQLQHQSLQWIFRVDLFWAWLVWSPCCPRKSQEFSPDPQFESIILQYSAFFMVQLSKPYMTTGKTRALTIWHLSAKWCLCFLIHCLNLS